MIKTVFAALAGTLIAAATPALADNAKPDAEPAAASAPAPQAAPAAKPHRYCVVDTSTGSRLPKRDCRTRDAWLATGFDPLKK